MNMQIDWREELDSSFGDGTDRPPADYLAPGRAALRRRRTAMGATALATVLVVGGIGWAAAPDDDGTRGSQIASDGASPVPAESARTYAPVASRPGDVRPPLPSEAVYFEEGSVPVAAVGSGELVRKAGWEIQAIDVLENRPKRRVWAISAVPVAGGEAIWMILDWTPLSGSTTSDPEGKRFADFQDWVDATWAELQAMEEGGQGPDAFPDPPVVHMNNGELVVPPEVTLLETVEHPEEAAAYGPVAEFVAVKLRRDDGEIYFAIVGTDTFTTVDAAALDAPTMTAFLAHLQTQGDSGEGLR